MNLQKYKKFQTKAVNCTYCGRVGHFENKCWKKCRETDNNDDFEWYIDSGATSHFTKTIQWVSDLQKDSGKIVAADRKSLQVLGKGTVTINPADVKKDSLRIENVKVVPGLALNLLSVSQIVQKGLEVRFRNNGVDIIDQEGIIIAKGVHENNMFKLQQRALTGKAMTTKLNDSDLWHKRLGHLNVDSMKKLREGLVTGISFSNSHLESCISCAKGKQHRFPFKRSKNISRNLLDLVHSDLCGPMEVDSIAGSKYFVTFIDDYSRQVFVYFLSFKSEVFEAFKSFEAMVTRQTGRNIKVLRTDNGGEYVNNRMKRYLSSSGIIHQTTVPYSPQQNGIAERANRTIVEKARCMLFEAKLSKKLWAEAVLTATYLMNRSPHQALTLTPIELWSGKKPDLSHLRVFGTQAMAYIPKPNRQ